MIHTVQSESLEEFIECNSESKSHWNVYYLELQADHSDGEGQLDAICNRMSSVCNSEYWEFLENTDDGCVMAMIVDPEQTKACSMANFLSMEVRNGSVIDYEMMERARQEAAQNYWDEQCDMVGKLYFLAEQKLSLEYCILAKVNNEIIQSYVEHSRFR